MTDTSATRSTILYYCGVVCQSACKVQAVLHLFIAVKLENAELIALRQDKHAVAALIGQAIRFHGGDDPINWHIELVLEPLRRDVADLKPGTFRNYQVQIVATCKAADKRLADGCRFLCSNNILLRHGDYCRSIIKEARSASDRIHPAPKSTGRFNDGSNIEMPLDIVTEPQPGKPSCKRPSPTSQSCRFGENGLVPRHRIPRAH